MGNSGSSPPPDSNNDVLVHSFQLDADADFCSLPICWPNKQAMFHTPKAFSARLKNFLPYQDGVKMIGEINKILRGTAFPNRQCNLFFLLCTIMMFCGLIFGVPSLLNSVIPDYEQILNETEEEQKAREKRRPKEGNQSFVLIFAILPYILYFGLMIYKKSSRKSQLLEFVQSWNEKQNNGVYISLGGGGTLIRRNISTAVGSETGGNYEHFHMATWDPKSLMIRGYLHVFVKEGRNSVPAHQPTVEQQNAPQTPNLTVPAGYEVPVGFALVPQNYQPLQNFPVPAGYALVPQTQENYHPLQDIQVPSAPVP